MANWKALERLVSEQDFISEVYEDTSGHRCFIGELAARGGYAGQMVGVHEGVRVLPALAKAASRWSGLTLKELTSLQHVNDNARTVLSRREGLLWMLGELREDRVRYGHG